MEIPYARTGFMAPHGDFRALASVDLCAFAPRFDRPDALGRRDRRGGPAPARQGRRTSQARAGGAAAGGGPPVVPRRARPVYLASRAVEFRPLWAELGGERTRNAAGPGDDSGCSGAPMTAASRGRRTRRALRGPPPA